MHKSFRDRRIFERIPAKFSLKFLNLRSNKECSAQTRDISAEGIGLVTEEVLFPYAPLEIRLQIPDKGEPLCSRGEAVWSMMVEPKKYRAGISLAKPDLMGISRVLRLRKTRTENSAVL
jgi:hypothetical protein